MKQQLEIKVCGITESNQAEELSKLGVKYIGNIFFEKSPRNVVAKVDVSGSSKKVAVVVNASLEYIQKLVLEHGIDIVQLHGNESNGFAEKVKALGVGVWKVFKVDDSFDWTQVEAFNAADAFLFDTKTEKHGGSGKKFNWELLKQHKIHQPFWLSGGIGIEDVDAIRNLSIPHLVGVDINSCFEVQPGIKDLKKVEGFIKRLNR